MKLFRDGNPGWTTGLWLIAALYVILLYCGLRHHEMWQDEMHHFLLARDSASLSDLFYNARFEGHPPLWNILLFGLVQLSSDPVSMQWLHLIIAALAMGIFLRHAPFAFAFKVLFAGGYFMLYEYGVISRNYALSLLFLFLCCALLSAPRKKYGRILLCIVLLSCSHLFALFCAIPLLWLTARAYSRDENRNLSRTSFRLSTGVVALILAGILWSLAPSGGHMIFHYDAEPALSMKRFSKAFSIFLKGLFPVPDIMQTHWWNSTLLAEMTGPLRGLVALACLAAPVILFYNRPASLLVFYFTSLSIAFFLFCSPLLGGMRYAGFIFILLVTALWLERIFPGKGEALPGLRMAARLQSRKGAFIYFILVVQCMAAAFAYSKDIRQPFSEGKYVAAWLLDTGRYRHTVALSDQTAGPAVSGYLGRKVFYPETNDYGSFCRWNTVPFLLEKKEIIHRLQRLTGSGTFLKNDDSFGEGGYGSVVYEDSLLRLNFLTRFDGAVVRTENYWVYSFTCKVPGKPDAQRGSLHGAIPLP